MKRLFCCSLLCLKRFCLCIKNIIFPKDLEYKFQNSVYKKKELNKDDTNKTISMQKQINLKKTCYNGNQMQGNQLQFLQTVLKYSWLIRVWFALSY